MPDLLAFCVKSCLSIIDFWESHQFEGRYKTKETVAAFLFWEDKISCEQFLEFASIKMPQKLENKKKENKRYYEKNKQKIKEKRRKNRETISIYPLY